VRFAKSVRTAVTTVPIEATFSKFEIARSELPSRLKPDVTGASYDPSLTMPKGQWCSRRLTGVLSP